MPDAEPLAAEVTRSGSESEDLASFRDVDVPPSNESAPSAIPEFMDETAEESAALAEFDDLTFIQSLPDLDALESDEPEENTQPSIDAPTFLREDEL